MKKLLLITWVSASWKTTLQEELLRRGWNRPINFTTRQPRDVRTILELEENKKNWIDEEEKNKNEDFSSRELDEYVFLTQEQFFDKLSKWHFLESTNYWGNFYAVSKHLPEGNVAIIVDPVWRAQIMEKVARELEGEYELFTAYLNISIDEQVERLEKRWTVAMEISNRLKDFIWMHPTDWCKQLDGTKDVEQLADELEEFIFIRKF